MKMDFKYSIDEVVYDKLSHKYVKLVGISYKIGKQYYDSRVSSMGQLTYCVDDPINDGERDIWEITKKDSVYSSYEDEAIVLKF